MFSSLKEPVGIRELDRGSVSFRQDPQKWLFRDGIVSQLLNTFLTFMRPWGLSPTPSKLECSDVTVSSREVEARRLGMQGCPQLHSKFEARVGSMKPSLRREEEKGSL